MEAPQNCNYPEYVLRLQKTSKMTNQLIFFLWKTEEVEAWKVITNSLIILDFLTPNFFDNFFWPQYFHIRPVINETKDR